MCKYKHEQLYLHSAGMIMVCVLAILAVTFQKGLEKQVLCSWINENINQQEEYRAISINETLFSYMTEAVQEKGQMLPELLADMYFYEKLYHQEFYGTDIQEKKIAFVQKNYSKQYESLLESNRMIWQDIRYFPVAWCDKYSTAWVTYGDSWRFERSYGGKRTHEGCDIMAEINERGLYPVVSITDGIIEKKGWLEKGGYRIGIRAPHGGYYYYAHLYSYSDIQVGQQVKAGELLGFMGDSGYGTEGTTGKFPVHLHVGIYIQVKGNQEQSVNPYPVMKYLENKKIQLDYK